MKKNILAITFKYEGKIELTSIYEIFKSFGNKFQIYKKKKPKHVKRDEALETAFDFSNYLKYKDY